MTTHSEKLLPCPFCGEDAEMFFEKDGPFYTVGCANKMCGLRPLDHFNVRKRACDAWNTRAIPDHSELVKVLVEAADKVATWFEMQAKISAEEAKATRFVTMREAFDADAKNYLVMARCLRKPIRLAAEKGF